MVKGELAQVVVGIKAVQGRFAVAEGSELLAHLQIPCRHHHQPLSNVLLNLARAQLRSDFRMQD